MFHDSVYHEVIIKRVCCIFGKLRSKSNAIWIEWISLLEAEKFLLILTIFKNFIVSIGPPPPSTTADEALIGAIKAMSIMCQANDKKNIIPYSAFYLVELCNRLNFKEEFKRWQKSRSSKTVTEFSFFNYPFLFDPVAKKRIMHIDAMVKMSLQYEDACVKQALVMHAQRFLDDSDAMKNMEVRMKELSSPYLVLEIRRSHFVTDVLEQVFWSSIEK